MKRNQGKFVFILTAVLAASVLLAACAPVVTREQTQPQATPPPVTQHIPDTGAAEAQTDPLVFQQAVRQLWEDHILWTRVYVIGAVAELAEADAAAERLLQNQQDLGDAIKPFYGDEAGEQLTSLLREHILTATELVAAAKAGDEAQLETASAAWYDNADRIGAFLSSANPDHWPESEMQAMMRSHLDLTLEEATARLEGDWAADVGAYDKVHDDILKMADMLATGIIQQFPERFAPQQASAQQVELTLAMDKLWEDHITWTRMYMISATSGLPDADAAAGRLLQNQVDIGNALKPVYGEEAGEQLTALLNEHILTAVELLSAAKSGDDAGFEAAKEAWYENADQIAAFLSSANPDHWPESEMRDMMRLHLDLTLEEATARLEGDWTADTAAYDRVRSAILEMSAMLTEGIVAQFPDQFE